MTHTLAHPFASLARLAHFPARQHARTAPASVALGKDRFIVAPTKAATVSCVQGSLWITHDNETVDILISAGETYTRQYASRMLVFALEPSSVAVN